jgi:steroid 5-alpha reductase family enzyme
MLDAALSNALLACACLVALTWVLSLLTREHSWVDRLWSIAPVGYVASFAWASGFAPRLALMTALTLAWGVRLTFNYARKGGYAPGGEDYRWLELRKRMSPVAFQIFNLLFIAGFQNVLLLAITLPAWAAAQQDAALGWADGLLALTFLMLLAVETVADEQQWRFQNRKRAAVARGEPAEPFLSTGLFRWSRHPNFFAEQAMWWVIALFAVLAGSRAWGLVLAGPTVLVLLFFGSTRFTEELSLRKYPSYAEYQRRTSKLVPWWPRS